MRFCNISQQPPACKHLRFAPAWNCFLLKDKSLWLGLVLLCPLGVRLAALCSAPPGCGAPRLPGPRHGPIRHRTTAQGNKSPPQAAADIRAWRTQENLEITQLYSSQHRATHSRGETSRRQGKAASKPVCEPLPNPSSCRRRNIPALPLCHSAAAQHCVQALQHTDQVSWGCSWAARPLLAVAAHQQELGPTSLCRSQVLATKMWVMKAAWLIARAGTGREGRKHILGAGAGLGCKNRASVLAEAQEDSKELLQPGALFKTLLTETQPQAVPRTWESPPWFALQPPHISVGSPRMGTHLEARIPCGCWICSSLYIKEQQIQHVGQEVPPSQG